MSHASGDPTKYDLSRITWGERPRSHTQSEKSNRANPDGLRAQLETSLQRLGCDRFDVYQAHGVTDLAELDRLADKSPLGYEQALAKLSPARQKAYLEGK